MQYAINNTILEYEALGTKFQGDDVVLLQQAIDLTAKTSWRKQGYTVETLFATDVYALFMQHTSRLLVELWQKSGLPVPSNFLLDQYHRLAKTTALHLAAVEQTKLIQTEFFPVPIQLLEQRISEICNQELVV